MKKTAVSLIIVLVLALAIFGYFYLGNNNKDKSLRIGASPTPHAEILEKAAYILKDKYDIDVDIKIFTDYVIPNEALVSNELDVNYFQHLPYLEEYNEKNKTDIVSIGQIHFEPLGIYPGKTNSIEGIQVGAKIAVPNDPTNEARALNLLQEKGLIKLKENVGLSATKEHIVENNLSIQIIELEAAQIVQSLGDVDLAVINGNYALGARLTQKVLALESNNSLAAQEYANIIAVLPKNQDNDSILKLIEVLKSEDIKNFINERYEGNVLPIS